MERKLAAILCADVFGYSRLMGENEEATLRTLSSHREIIDSLIEQHRERFVNSAGEGGTLAPPGYGHPGYVLLLW
jgi:adenylate cyclase